MDRRTRRYRPQAESLEGRDLPSAGLMTRNLRAGDGRGGLSGGVPAYVLAARKAPVVRPEALAGGLSTGAEDATAQIQALIDATPVNGTLMLPAGTYLISKPILISKPMTLTTQGLENLRRPLDPLAGGTLDLSRYATLKASPTLLFGMSTPSRDQDKGLLMVRPPEGQATLSNVHIRNIALDGNGANRGKERYSSNQLNCSNINMQNTDNSSFVGNVSFDALYLGFDPYSNVFIDCNNLTINDNLFYENGDATIGSVPPNYNGSYAGTNSLEVQAKTRNVRVEIKRNRVYDSTLLGIVAGTYPDRRLTGEIAYNEVRNFKSMSFGSAIAIYGQGSFGNGRLQDPRKTLLVHHNVIDGNAGGATIPGTSTRIRQIPFGISLGNGPYGLPPDQTPGYDTKTWHMTGSRVYQNTILNAQIGIGVDQSGSAAEPTYILDNTIGGSVGLAFNKSPQASPADSPNVIVTNKFAATNRQGRTRQVGKLALYPASNKPASWSALSTRYALFGDMEQFRRLLAAAPKPFPNA